MLWRCRTDGFRAGIRGAGTPGQREPGSQAAHGDAVAFGAVEANASIDKSVLLIVAAWCSVPTNANSGDVGKIGTVATDGTSDAWVGVIDRPAELGLAEIAERLGDGRGFADGASVAARIVG